MKKLMKRGVPLLACMLSAVLFFAACTPGDSGDGHTHTYENGYCTVCGEPDPDHEGGSGDAEPEGYYNTFTMTEGDLLVYGKAEGLNTAQQFFAESVQGLFAQKGESKYYHHVSGQYETWLHEIETEYGKGSRNVTVAEMLEDYKANIGTGYVLYDAADAESVNCARTVAGAEGVAMVDLSLKSWAEENGLEQFADATQMSAEDCFDAYKDKLDPSGLVQQRGSLIQLTDWAIANKYYCYFIEGMGVPDLQLRGRVQEWCAGCAVYGWCPVDEGTDVGFSSGYGSFTLASDYCYNMTVYSCTAFFGEERFTQPNKTDADVSGYATDKHYVTIVNSDGDNLQCWYGGTFEQEKYMGAARGDFAFGWSVSPTLYSLGPNILARTYRNAQAGDAFVCSVSGLGYTYPQRYSVEQLERYCAVLDTYLAATDLSVVKILDSGLPEKTIEAYAQMENAEGFLFCTYANKYVDEHGSVYWSENGKPFVSCRATLWDTTAQDVAEQINAYPADATSIEGYTYVNLHVWSMDYTDVAEMARLLDDDVVIVDPETFIRLIKQNVPHEDVKLSA